MQFRMWLTKHRIGELIGCLDDLEQEGEFDLNYKNAFEEVRKLAEDIQEKISAGAHVTHVEMTEIARLLGSLRRMRASVNARARRRNVKRYTDWK